MTKARVHRKVRRGLKKAKKLSLKVRATIARKIRILMREGYRQKQAIAIAYRMAGVARRKK